jgi:HKD family nuclease
MRLNILEWLDGIGDDTAHIVILTHNIDFLFVENVLLPRMRRLGEPSLTIFVDAASADLSYRNQFALLDELGRRYRVIAVDLGSLRRFHPKALFVCKKDGARLAVGSGNLTAGGYGGNYEAWATWESEVELGPPLASFMRVLKRLPGLVSMPERVEEFVGNLAEYPWVKSLPQPGNLFDSLESPLLDQILQSLPESAVEITVASPYFDPGLVALRRIAERSGAPVNVLLQPGRAGIEAAAAATLSRKIALLSAVPASLIDQSRFMHAKFYMIRTATSRLLFVGSANCSQAALLRAPQEANAELMAFSRVSADQWGDFLNELVVTNEPPSLPEEIQLGDPEKFNSQLRIVAAKYEMGVLAVELTNTLGLVSFQLDGTGTEVKSAGATQQERIEFKLESAKHSIFVRGYLGDGSFSDSPLSWVDDEELLGMSSPSRRMQRKLGGAQSDMPWAVTDYSEILEIFGDHLMDDSVRYRAPKTNEPESEKGGIYSLDDIFAASTASFVLQIANYREPTFGDADALKTLLSLLGVTEAAKAAKVDDSEESTLEERTDEELREAELPMVGRVEDHQVDPKALERHRRRLMKAINAIEKTVADYSFVQRRPAARLSADLGALGLLLRKAFADGALTAVEFGGATANIWKSVFAGVDPAGGSLIRYWRSLEPQEQAAFQRGMQDPRLAASLTVWFYPDWPGAEEKSWFDLSISLICSAATRWRPTSSRTRVSLSQTRSVP